TSAPPPRTSSIWSRAARACSASPWAASGARSRTTCPCCRAWIRPMTPPSLCRTSWRRGVAPVRPADRRATHRTTTRRALGRGSPCGRIGVVVSGQAVPPEGGPGSGVLPGVHHGAQQGVEVLGEALAGGALVPVQRHGTALRLLQAHALLDDGLEDGIAEQLPQLRQAVLVLDRAGPVAVHCQPQGLQARGDALLAHLGGELERTVRRGDGEEARLGDDQRTVRGGQRHLREAVERGR